MDENMAAVTRTGFLLLLLFAPVKSRDQGERSCRNSMLANIERGDDQCEVLSGFTKCLFRARGLHRLMHDNPEIIATLQNEFDTQLAARGGKCSPDVRAIFDDLMEEDKNGVSQTTRQPTGYKDATTVDECLGTFLKERSLTCNNTVPFFKCVLRVRKVPKTHQKDYTKKLFVKNYLQRLLSKGGLECDTDIVKFLEDKAGLIRSELGFEPSNHYQRLHETGRHQSHAPTASSCYYSLTTDISNDENLCDIISNYIKCRFRTTVLSLISNETITRLQNNYDALLAAKGIRCSVDVSAIFYELREEAKKGVIRTRLQPTGYNQAKTAGECADILLMERTATCSKAAPFIKCLLRVLDPHEIRPEDYPILNKVFSNMLSKMGLDCDINVAELVEGKVEHESGLAARPFHHSHRVHTGGHKFQLGRQPSHGKPPPTDRGRPTVHAPTIGSCIDSLTAATGHGEDTCDPINDYIKCILKATGLSKELVTSPETVATLQDRFETSLAARGIKCSVNVRVILDELMNEEKNGLSETRKQLEGYEGATTMGECLDTFIMERTATCSNMTPFIKCLLRVERIHQISQEDYPIVRRYLQETLSEIGLDCEIDVAELFEDKGEHESRVTSHHEEESESEHDVEPYYKKESEYEHDVEPSDYKEESESVQLVQPYHQNQPLRVEGNGSVLGVQPLQAVVLLMFTIISVFGLH